MSGNPSQAEKRDLARWLDASPQHRLAYDAVAALWGDLGAIAEGVGEDLSGPLERIADHRRRQRRGGAASLAVICLAILAASLWFWIENPHVIQNLGADQVTARAERRQVTLADGSTVLMDADTALDIRISPAERRIRLLRGGAFFSVRPSDTPFIVEAENGEARVLGTKFDVAMNGNGGVTVTLSSGRIEVALAGDAGQVILAPGESVEYDRAGLGPVREVDLEESAAWHDGRLIFDNMRLADVLTQIGRYRDGRIILLGSALGERRVTGNISLENADAALDAMQSTVGFRMTRLGGKLTVIGP